MVKLAKKLERVSDPRGKEPTYVNNYLLDLLPISIPDEKDLAPGTKFNILDSLERDCSEWEVWLESEKGGNGNGNKNTN